MSWLKIQLNKHCFRIEVIILLMAPLLVLQGIVQGSRSKYAAGFSLLCLWVLLVSEASGEGCAVCLTHAHRSPGTPGYPDHWHRDVKNGPL